MVVGTQKSFRVFFASIPFLFLNAACANSSGSEENWIRDNIPKDEHTLCVDDKPAGVMFVSGHGGMVKVGVLVNADDGHGGALGFSVDTYIEDKEGSPIIKSGVERYRREYSMRDGEYYAEWITGFPIYGDWKDGGKLKVEFVIGGRSDNGGGEREMPTEVDFSCSWQAVR